MRTKMLGLLTLVCTGSLLLAACDEGGSDSQSNGGDSNDSHKVTLITMDSTDQHWVSVNEGAERAVEDADNIDYNWLAPDVKDDSQQIERINNAVSDGADIIIIAANGPDAVTAPLEEAIRDGVEIIYVDSAANAEALATFSTDNEAAGTEAGEVMIANLEEEGITSGDIGIVNFDSATQTAVQREQGFRDAFEGTDFNLLQTQYNNDDVSEAQNIADNYISQGVVGIYSTNEGSTVGVGNAIRGSGEDIIGVGFDQSNAILSLIEDGFLTAVMAQNPDTMGYEAVQAAIKALNDEEIEETEVDTGVSVLTIDDI